MFQVKHCEVEKKGDSTKVYDLMPTQNGDICLDYFTRFANTANSFQSKNAMSFKFKGFQWDMSDAEVCTLFLLFFEKKMNEKNCRQNCRKIIFRKDKQ